jgi:hypothetical protein
MVNSYCSQQLLASIPLSKKRDVALASTSRLSPRRQARLTCVLTGDAADRPPHKG